MKGLIYKELFLGRKVYIGYMGIVLGLMLLGGLVSLSMICGNMYKVGVSDQDKVNFFYIFTYSIYCILLSAVLESLDSIHRDETSGWKRFEYTIPMSAIRNIAVRYISNGIVLGVVFLAGILNAGIMSILFGQALTAELFKNMLILLAVVMVLFWVGMPIFLRFPFRSIISTICVGLMALSMVMLVIIFKYPKMIDKIPIAFKEFKNFCDGVGMILPIIMIVLMGISFMLSVAFYQRREK